MDAGPRFPNQIEIVPLREDGGAQACARLMSTSEPWITLGRSFETSLAIVRDPGSRGLSGPGHRWHSRVPYSLHDRRVRGLHPDHLHRSALRGRGLGSPNIFLCVSSFNDGARRLYERLGYAVVGELINYIVQGQSEILLRKTRGPLADFSASR